MTIFMWRIIPFDKYNPYLKTALNEVLIQSVKKTQQPTIWLSGWSETCINIGFGQKLKQVVNINEARNRDIRVVRRQGGGGATLLTPDGEISWAIVAPEKHFPKDVNDTYKHVCQYIIDALNELGIKAQHKPINDVITNKGKISGSTYKKESGVIYTAGTLLVKADKSLMNTVLQPEKDHIKQSLPEKDKQVTSISEFIDIPFEKIVETLKNTLTLNKDIEEKNWTTEELLLAQKLQQKYETAEWINRA